jgi:hypothetical protein
MGFSRGITKDGLRIEMSTTQPLGAKAYASEQTPINANRKKDTSKERGHSWRLSRGLCYLPDTIDCHHLAVMRVMADHFPYVEPSVETIARQAHVNIKTARERIHRTERMGYTTLISGKLGGAKPALYRWNILKVWGDIAPEDQARTLWSPLLAYVYESDEDSYQTPPTEGRGIQNQTPTAEGSDPSLPGIKPLPSKLVLRHT